MQRNEKSKKQGNNKNLGTLFYSIPRDVLGHLIHHYVHGTDVLALNAACVNTNNAISTAKLALAKDEMVSPEHLMPLLDHYKQGGHLATFKLVMIGGVGTQKTKILNHFIPNTNIVSTIGVECRIKEIHANNAFIALQIWDTAGQERFRSMRQMYTRGANTIIIVVNATQDEPHHYVSDFLFGLDIKNCPALVFVDRANITKENEASIDSCINAIKAMHGKRAECYIVDSTTGAGIEHGFRKAASLAMLPACDLSNYQSFKNDNSEDSKPASRCSIQ